MMLLGTLLARGRPKWHLRLSEKYGLGYAVTTQFQIRHQSLEFLLWIQRELDQKEIRSKIRGHENWQRTKHYTLHIGKRKDQYSLVDYLLRVSPIELNFGRWPTYLEAIEIIRNREHLTQDGMDKLMILKGLIE
tara:strand:+ start:1569 stop:1970 length:402 start_codon:yes stop_codon:yes gene_type:complete